MCGALWVREPGDIIKSKDKKDKLVKRVVNHCTKNMISWTPRTRASSVGVLEELNNKESVSAMMATTRVVDDTPTVRKSPEVLGALLEVQKTIKK